MQIFLDGKNDLFQFVIFFSSLLIPWEFPKKSFPNIVGKCVIFSLCFLQQSDFGIIKTQ